MKRMYLGSALAMLLFPAIAGAQTTQTVRGQVCDVASGEPMIGDFNIPQSWHCQTIKEYGNRKNSTAPLARQ